MVSLNVYTPFGEGAAGAATTAKLLGVAVLTFENTAKINAQ